jgi:hypothetical protein
MLSAVKLPPATARLLVGSLCLCACTVPVFVGGTEAMTGGAEGSGTTDHDEPTSSDGGESESGAEPWSTTSSSESSAEGSSGEPQQDDMPTMDGPKCEPPDEACVEAPDDLASALGLGCGSFVATAPLAVAGPPDSRGVTAGLGAGSTFLPRFGSHAVVLSTGVATHAAMTALEVEETTDCSQVGLPCPSTDFPEEYDLSDLPAPLTVEEANCMNDPQPAGDCSKTVGDQWKSEPRLAHDYTELRFSAVVPDNTIAVSLAVAFLTTERPTRFPGGYNDFLVVWLDSEQWTGNIAIHPEQGVPIAADALLEYAHLNQDPAIADFAFAGHAATDWFRISKGVTPGETVTLVVALFDQSDGAADSAVLLDDLRWECDAVSRP